MFKWTSYQKGYIAELYCLIFLCLKGYWPLKWRMRNKAGEVDIIMRKKNIYIGIEVKYRKSHDQALYAIETQQKKRIRRALAFFIAHNVYDVPQEIRCDVVVIDQVWRICHLKNAF